MGIFDIFNQQRESVVPIVPSVLPDMAKQQILNGKLPILNTNNLFLKNGEICHYADHAIYEKHVINKKRVGRNTGYSMPGFFKGTRVYIGGSKSEYINDDKYITIKGVLYITTKRVIFVGRDDVFNRKIDDIVAVIPYANCIELQFSKETIKLFVPDGNLAHIVLKLI